MRGNWDNIYIYNPGPGYWAAAGSEEDSNRLGEAEDGGVGKVSDAEKIIEALREVGRYGKLGCRKHKHVGSGAGKRVEHVQHVVCRGEERRRGEGTGRVRGHAIAAKLHTSLGWQHVPCVSRVTNSICTKRTAVLGGRAHSSSTVAVPPV